MTERLPDDPTDLPDSGYWYIPAFFAGNQAFVLDLLGEHTKARETMIESLAALPAEWREAEWAWRRRAFVES